MALPDMRRLRRKKGLAAVCRRLGLTAPAEEETG